MFWVDVNEGISDPIRALSEYYVYDRPSCPRTYGDQPRRAEYATNMIKEFKVDGAIGERMAFCDLWLLEHYMHGLDFKEEGVPFLKLDREYILSGVGQMRTRIQAFLETMGK
jgi:benzoyl-CoA reductase/2-hydroxyglutaryl-CoA dehydratase subunit BcrC/BadD/HgdB